MKKISALASTALSILAISSALAQTPALYWDPGATGPTTGGSSGGTGNWDTSSSLWYDGIANDGIWTNGDDAYFTNTAGTVTLQLNVTASDIYFTNITGNYYITNATGVEQLTVNNTIDTGGSEDTIAAVVNNSGTLNKNGAGRLHLPGANNLNGNVMVNEGELSVENNNALGGSATVANGAALELNSGTNNGLLENLNFNLTINGTGVTNGGDLAVVGGALDIVSGYPIFYGQITLAGNSEIYVSNNAAFLYYGSGNDVPITDNGNGYNLTIAGPGGNVQFKDYGLDINGSLIVAPGAGCYMYVSGSTQMGYTNSYVSSNATLLAQADNGLGTQPGALMKTNVIVDGGEFIGYGNWAMYGTRGITVTTNGGTIADTDTSSGSDWYTADVFSSNTPVTFASSGGTIRIADSSGSGNGTNVVNLGTGALIASGGNVSLSYCTNTLIYSNLVVNGSIFTFNYDQTSGQLSQLGALPTSFCPSNIWISGGQIHVGHSTTIAPSRGIYVTSAGTSIEEVTGSGTATMDSSISGPGNISFISQTIDLATNNSYANTTVNSGVTVKVGNGGAYGTLGTGPTADNGTLTFDRTGSYSYNQYIAGSGVVNMAANGVVTLSGNNTYTGATTISAGTLLLNGSNTGTGAVNVNSGGALGGSGTIPGAVTVASGGTLALSTNKLTINNNLSIAGNVTVLVNSSFTPSSGEAVVSGTLANSGTGSIIVTNLGPALTQGETFTLFSQPVTGGASMTVTGGGTGVTWNNNLAQNGTISVASAPATSKPVINSVHINGGNFIFSGTNGSDNATYYVLSTTNLTIPVSQWTIVSTNTFLGNGQFSVTNPINPGTPQSFYLLQAQ